MPNHLSILEAFRRLNIEEWSTWDEGPTRTQAFRYSATADYDGTPTDIRFGAFVGWVEDRRWWVDLATRLNLTSLDQLPLLDIEHQAAGHSCIAWFCVASPVTIRQSRVAFVEELCTHFYHAQGGWMDARSGDQYQERIRIAGLTARCASEYFMESVYPLDATDSNLNALLARPAQALTALEPLVSDEIARERMRIFIIADNSD